MKKRVAILVENLFEDSEFQIPYTALQRADAEVVVLGSRMNDEYSGKQGKVTIKPDATATEVRSEDFEAIVIPGGVAPDRIRANPNAVRLVMNAMAQEKMVAAVCHGPQVLIEADQLRGRRATGFSSIRKDIQNAGATYEDEAVVVDGNLITSRQPSDLAAFATTILINLGLNIEGTVFPELSDRTFAWWKLAEEWGGSSRLDILAALNTAIIGERYTLATFEKYVQQINSTESQVVLNEVVTTKRQNIQLLEQRLSDFNEQVTWQAAGSEAFATLQSWLQSSTTEKEILRRALGDVQTGVVDAYHLSIQLTDPATVGILSQIEENLHRHEERLGDLYRSHFDGTIEPPTPTTLTAPV
jgi:protease I